MAIKDKRRVSLGLFFWVAFILLVALLFFINKDNITTVIEKTGAKNIFQKKEQALPVSPEGDLLEIQNEIEKITAENDEQNSVDVAKSIKPKISSDNSIKHKKLDDKKEVKESRSNIVINNNKDKNSKKNNNTENVSSKKEYTTQLKKNNSESNTGKNIEKEKLVEANKQKKEIVKTEKRNIFFVHVEEDGKITKKKVTKEIAKTNSPMSEAIKELLKNVSIVEAKQGLRSFIPPDTKLLSAYVKNGTAFISLSEEFQFNHYGIEAYQAQLAQIVFTACEFQTVKNVQILIEGEHKNYLGGDGVWIGTPLSRESF